MEVGAETVDKRRRGLRVAVGAAALCTLLVVTAHVGGSRSTELDAVGLQLGDVVQKLQVVDRVLQSEDHSYAAILHLRQRSRLGAVNHPGEHLVGEDRQELAMEPHGGLHEMVQMLAAEVARPGVCAKRELIMSKLEALLKRLGGRAVTVNATDNQYRKSAESALTVWYVCVCHVRMCVCVCVCVCARARGSASAGTCSLPHAIPGPRVELHACAAAPDLPIYRGQARSRNPLSDV